MTLEPEVPLGAPEASRFRLVVAVTAMIAVLALSGLYVVFSVVQGRQSIAERNEQAESRLRDFEQEQLAAQVDLARANQPAELPFAEEWGSSANVVLQPGEVAFVHRVPGDDYGRVGVVSPTGERRLLDISCERMHLSGAVMVCLDGPDLTGNWIVKFRDLSEATMPRLHQRTGALPSRARVNTSSGWATASMFTSGSGYQDVGGFTSIVRLYDLADDAKTWSVERFDLVPASPDFFAAFPGLDGSLRSRHSEPNPNFWGATFGDDDTFWVTGGFGDTTEILSGSAVDRTLTPTGLLGSCPSLSPDGSTLVFKQAHAEMADGFQLVARDLASGRTWPLGESRSVDDQVEWLDNDTLLYALHAPAAEASETVQPEFDVWALDIAEGAEPQLFIPQADSPAVLR